MLQREGVTKEMLANAVLGNYIISHPGNYTERLITDKRLKNKKVGDQVSAFPVPVRPDTRAKALIKVFTKSSLNGSM